MAEDARERGRRVGRRGARALSWLAWSLAGLSLVMFLAGAVLDVLLRSARSQGTRVTVGTVGNMLIYLSLLAFP